MFGFFVYVTQDGTGSKICLVGDGASALGGQTTRRNRGDGTEVYTRGFVKSCFFECATVCLVLSTVVFARFLVFEGTLI